MLAVAEMKQVEAWLASWSGYEGGHTNQSLEGRTEVEWVAEDRQVNDLARVIAAELSLTVWESGSDENQWMQIFLTELAHKLHVTNVLKA